MESILASYYSLIVIGLIASIVGGLLTAAIDATPASDGLVPRPQH